MTNLPFQNETLALHTFGREHVHPAPWPESAPTPAQVQEAARASAAMEESKPLPDLDQVVRSMGEW